MLRNLKDSMQPHYDGPVTLETDKTTTIRWTRRLGDMELLILCMKYLDNSPLQTTAWSLPLLEWNLQKPRNCLCICIDCITRLYCSLIELTIND